MPKVSPQNEISRDPSDLGQSPRIAVFERLLTGRMLMCCMLGFSSGLPRFLVVGLMQTWLRREGMSLRELGLLGLTSLPYTFKFLWAPLLDSYSFPRLGRRRGWALLTQLVLMGIIASLGLFNRKESLTIMLGLAMALSFFSASQDIAVNAYQRELLVSDEDLGLGTSLHVNAYRIAQLASGFGLVLSDSIPWVWVFPIISLFLLVGVASSLFGPDVPVVVTPPQGMVQAFVEPLREFFARKGRRQAVTILGFLLFYKLGDAMATSLLSAFYVDMGFTNTQIGYVTKSVSLISIITGVLVAGVVMARIGIHRALWIFGGIQFASIFGFALLVSVGPSLWALAAVVGFEYLGVGLGAAAFVAFMASITDRRFTGTQFALFSSFVTIPVVVAGSGAGFLIEWLGYQNFFFLCALLAVPGLLLLPRVAPWQPSPVGDASAS